MKTKKSVAEGMENTRPRVSRKTLVKKEETNDNKVVRRIKRDVGKRSRKEVFPQEAETNKKLESGFRQAFRRFDDSMTVIREFFLELSPYISEMEKGILKSRSEIAKEKQNNILQEFAQSATQEDTDDLLELVENLSKQISKKSHLTNLGNGDPA